MAKKKKHNKIKGSGTALFQEGTLLRLSKTPAEQVIEIILVLKSGSNQAIIEDQSVSRTKRKSSFVSRYSVSDDVIMKLVDFTSKYKLNFDRLVKEIGLVYISGKVSAMEKAFKVELHEHEYHDAIARYKQQVRGHHGEHSIPKSLSKIVGGIIGLSHVPVMHHVVSDAETNFYSAAKGLETKWFTEYYNFPKSYTGRNQNIGIISCGGGITMKDIHSYCREMNIKNPPQVDFISVKGNDNSPGSSFGYDLELATDCLVGITSAPSARFKVYSTENSIKGFCDAVIKICSERRNRPQTVSYSWGASESNYSSLEIKAVNRVLKYAALACDVSIFCASGDKGSTNNYESDSSTPLVVQFPASSPWVTSCGGTKIKTNEEGKAIAEVAWNSPSNLYDILIQNASGGGFSNVVKMPDYQKKAFKEDKKSYKQDYRGVPDISAHADLSPGGISYWISVDGIYWLSGGTSAVAPLMASLTARINEALGKPIGFLNPYLYEMRNTAAIKSINEGNNIMKGGPESYQAEDGWDPCTGLGVPDGKMILAYLRKKFRSTSR